MKSCDLRHGWKLSQSQGVVVSFVVPGGFSEPTRITSAAENDTTLCFFGCFFLTLWSFKVLIWRVWILCATCLFRCKWMKVRENQTCTQHLLQNPACNQAFLGDALAVRKNSRLAFPTTRGVSFCYVHLARKQDPRDYEL